MAADSENTLRESMGIMCTSHSLIVELLRTPSMRSSQNASSTHSDEYQALGVEESKRNSMPILGMPTRDMVG